MEKKECLYKSEIFCISDSENVCELCVSRSSAFREGRFSMNIDKRRFGVKIPKIGHNSGILAVLFLFYKNGQNLDIRHVAMSYLILFCLVLSYLILKIFILSRYMIR